jgi:hypothetical protein
LCGRPYEPRDPSDAVDADAEVHIEIAPERYEDGSWPQLRHVVAARLKQLPVGHIAKMSQLVKDRAPVVGKLGAKKVPHVLDHHRARGAFRDDTERLREEVAVVLGTEPPAGSREWRTRNAPGHEVDVLVADRAEVLQIRLSDGVLPPSDGSKGLTGVVVVLDER